MPSKFLLKKLRSVAVVLVLAASSLPAASLILAASSVPAAAQEAGTRLAPMDVFGLEYASDPQISPDGGRVVYVRNFMDIMKDRARQNLWIVNADGSGHRALTTGNVNHSSPRWSPDGTRLLYIARDDNGNRQLFVRWLKTGETAKLTDLTRGPSGIRWSPDGRWIAFTAFVGVERKSFAHMPPKPEGAEWAAPARVTQELVYRRNGEGYVEPGTQQLFVVPSEGGSPRQLTSGPYDHSGTPAWTADGSAMIVSARRQPGWERDPGNTDLYEVSVADGSVRQLTDRKGPDSNPVVSPDGSTLAYLGYDDRYQGYQVTHLYVMKRDGSERRVLAADLDRDVGRPAWSADGKGLYFQYDDEGKTKLAYVTLGDHLNVLAEDVGGTSLGRPYSGGSFSVARDGRFAYTRSRPNRPADVAVGGGRGASGVRSLTALNDDLLGHRELGELEEIWFPSSHDGRRIQGWILKPPGFDPAGKYPLILEIHGGPFANYGGRFAAEDQLYAAAGYVVLYANPRGSTSYGEEFGNLIHHAYPGYDYDDLMSGVDAVLERGYVDPARLFVTGGSGGGVLSSWIVGKTGRFRAAAVQKPVINWFSWALTADMYVRGIKYWFPGPPWEYPEHYMARSPISLVGNVTTPTMLITGEVDYRTPISESEQFYQALKYRGIDAALVRIPGASHGITARPSNLIKKVVYVLGWFEQHGGPPEKGRPAATDGS